MRDVLITVSGSIPSSLADDIAAGCRPRADYLALAHACNADLIDYHEARHQSGLLGRLLEWLGGPNLVLAWACFLLRGRYRAILTDGEQVGLPLAWLLRFLGVGRLRPRHLMICHILSVRKKELLIDMFGLQHTIDQFIVYSTWQQQFIIKRWKLAAARVQYTPFMVDSQFFAPQHAAPGPASQPMICAVGLEARDYPTLLAACGSLPAQVVIAAASPWSKHGSGTQGISQPANVRFGRFSQHELRQLYADSRCVVMPLQNVNYQAGVTAILEAMAMERVVICSHTPGQRDILVHGETGLYVPPGDPQALQAAICYLLEHPHEAERIGHAARHAVEREFNLDCYTARFAEYLA